MATAPSIMWRQPMVREAVAEREGIQVHCCFPSRCNQKRSDLTNVAGWSFSYIVLALWAGDDGMMSDHNDSNALSALWVLNLKGPMECFYKTLEFVSCVTPGKNALKCMTHLEHPNQISSLALDQLANCEETVRVDSWHSPPLSAAMCWGVFFFFSFLSVISLKLCQILVKMVHFTLTLSS